jgi:hypothetical protein
MLVDEADAPQGESSGYPDGNFGLTISVADLSCDGNDDTNSQGHYDYQAHAHVLPGGADPLGSQGYASVVENILPALRRGPRSQKLAGVFVFGGKFGRRPEEEILTRE